MSNANASRSNASRSRWARRYRGPLCANRFPPGAAALAVHSSRAVHLPRALWLALAGCLMLGVAAPGQAQSLIDPALSLTTFASGFDQPTGMAFLGAGGAALVIEKETGLVKLVQGNTQTSVLDLPVNSSSERGLLGIAIDPQFSTNGHTYLYYSLAAGGADGGSWLENRLSRFTWNGSSLAGEVVLRSWAFDPAQGNGPNHDGGPLRFGPDGNLYGVVGDLNRAGIEQNNTGPLAGSSNAGGIFRLEPSGEIPASNPFFGQADPLLRPWYAYGVRNSFGLAFDPATGALWDTENGPSSYDEINRVDPGFNSGWTTLMGPDSRDPQSAADLAMLPGSAYSDPEFSWRTPIAVTSLAFLATSSANQTLGDALLVGDNNTGQLSLFRLNAARDGLVLEGGLADLVADNTTERNSLVFGTDFSVVTDIQVGPDGGIYVLSLGNGAIYRIAPTVLPVVGDANADRQVGAADYAVWAATFGNSGIALSADWDRNLSVGAADYALWAANFGAAPSPVPEPGTALLGGLGLAGLAVIRGRRRVVKTPDQSRRIAAISRGL